MGYYKPPIAETPAAEDDTFEAVDITGKTIEDFDESSQLTAVTYTP